MSQFDWAAFWDGCKRCVDCSTYIPNTRSPRCERCRRKRRNMLARERRDQAGAASDKAAMEDALRRKERDPFGRRVFGVL